MFCHGAPFCRGLVDAKAPNNGRAAFDIRELYSSHQLGGYRRMCICSRSTRLYVSRVCGVVDRRAEHSLEGACVLLLSSLLLSSVASCAIVQARPIVPVRLRTSCEDPRRRHCCSMTRKSDPILEVGLDPRFVPRARVVAGRSYHSQWTTRKRPACEGPHRRDAGVRARLDEDQSWWWCCCY